VKLDISLPYLTRGRPRRCSTMRDIYLSTALSVEVPEIGMSDAEPAFTALEKYSIVADPADGQNYFLKLPERTGIVAYSGQLYRRLGRPDEVEGGSLEAFTGNFSAREAEPGSGLAYGWLDTDRNALSFAARRQFEWHLERSGATDSALVRTWPQGAGPRGRTVARNAADISSAIREIEEIDPDLCAISERMALRQAAGLLAIDGDIWFRCRPPSWRVEASDGMDVVFVTLELALAPEGFDPVLSRRHFALDRLDDAREYMRLCADRAKGDDREYQVDDLSVDYEVHLPWVLDCDPGQEELARAGYAMATECMRYGRKNPGWLDGLPGRLRESLDEAARATLSTNYVLDEMGEISNLVGDLALLWEDCRCPLTYCESGPDRRRFSRMFIRRARELYEDSPIGVEIGRRADGAGWVNGPAR